MEDQQNVRLIQGFCTKYSTGISKAKLLCSVFCGLLFFSYNNVAEGQTDTARIILNAEVFDHDTLPTLSLKPYDVVEKPDPNAIKKLNEMNRLYVNVSKVLPYARIAKATLDEINEHISTLGSERERKAYIKEREKEMKERFEAELKSLTITQGRILIKLVDRETGESSYDLVKELRGTLVATFWQGMAHLFGSDLKTRYDAVGEDQAVEIIVRQIDSAGFKPIILEKKKK